MIVFCFATLRQGYEATLTPRTPRPAPVWERRQTEIAHGTVRQRDRLNGSEEMAQHFLERSAAQRFTVPHRANRAVIFKSTQFHKTGRFRFKTNYLSQRINISMLFGQFGAEE